MVLKNLQLSVLSHSDWKISKAISEFLSNSIDAQCEAKLPISDIYIGIYEKSFVISDQGSGIKSQHFSQGATTKRNKPEPIGGHGEGIRGGTAKLKSVGFSIEVNSRYISGNFVTKSDNIFLEYTKTNSFSGTQFIFGYPSNLTKANFLDIFQEVKQNFIFFRDMYELIGRNKNVEIHYPLFEPKLGGFFYKGLKADVGKKVNFMFAYNVNSYDQKLDMELRGETNFNRNIAVSSTYKHVEFAINGTNSIKLKKYFDEIGKNYELSEDGKKLKSLSKSIKYNDICRVPIWKIFNKKEWVINKLVFPKEKHIKITLEDGEFPIKLSLEKIPASIGIEEYNYRIIIENIDMCSEIKECLYCFISNSEICKIDTNQNDKLFNISIYATKCNKTSEIQKNVLFLMDKGAEISVSKDTLDIPNLIDL